MTTNSQQPRAVTDARNKRLHKDFLSGKYSVVELVAKYQISSARIYVIMKRMGWKGTK